MADWVINPLKNDGYPALLELGEPPIFDVDTLFVEPKPRNIWTIDGSENDGYPVVAWQPPIPQFNVDTLFVPPKPRNIWNIHSGVNNGYPFIDWQFDMPPTGYDRNIPYYRYITTESTEVEEWRKLLRLNYYNGSTMKRAYSYRFWNGTGWV